MLRPDFLVIETVRQMRALSAPLRIGLFDTLARSRKPLSIREMADAVGRPAAALYRHVEILRGAGLIRTTGVRGKGRDKTRLYAAAARHVRTPAAPRSAALRTALSQLGEAQGRYALRCFTRAVKSGAAVQAGAARDASVHHLMLSRKDLARLNAELDGFVARWSRNRSRVPEVSLAIVMGPLRKAK